MENDDEARTAIEELNEFEFEGQTIVVKESKPSEKKPFRPRDNGGYNNRYCIDVFGLSFLNIRHIYLTIRT